MNTKKTKVIVILGCTSSGKTAWGVKLARKFKGEIISADSRQVYKGLDIGAGKDLKEYGAGKSAVPYHLLDVAAPRQKYNLAKYQKAVFRALDEISARGRLPLIVGGSGLYLQVVVDNYNLASTKTDIKFREKLEKLGAGVLFKRLIKLNPKFALKLNNSEKNNSRRLARYIEIFKNESDFKPGKRPNSNYEFLIIGIDRSVEVLNKSITKRLKDRLENENLLGEIKKLHKNGLSWKRLESFGLEYRFGALYLQKKITYDEMIDKLTLAIIDFAKRQRTWWRKWEGQGAGIRWLSDLKEAEELVNIYIGK